MAGNVTLWTLCLPSAGVKVIDSLENMKLLEFPKARGFKMFMSPIVGMDILWNHPIQENRKSKQQWRKYKFAKLVRLTSIYQYEKQLIAQRSLLGIFSSKLLC